MKKKKIDFVDFYKKNYKKLLILPLLLFVFSIFMMVQTASIDGTPFYRDVSLKGGLSAIIEVNSNLSADYLRTQLIQTHTHNSFQVSEFSENGQNIGFIIDTDLEENDLIFTLENIFSTSFQVGENYNSNFISATLSNSFLKQAIYIMLISFIFMSVVIFIFLRSFVPSFIVVLSAIFDIIVTIGILNFLGINLSVAGIGALLMLIGYSIDTDILLTNRLVKEHGYNYFEKTFSAFKTGLLMTGTTLFAGVAAIILTNSQIIFEIALILVIGLIVDFISTWIQNASILLWWLEKKTN